MHRLYKHSEADFQAVTLVSDGTNLKDKIAITRLRVIALILVLSAAPVSRARAQISVARFEVTNYLIHVGLYPATHTIVAKARINFTPITDLSAMSFNLNSNLKVKTVTDAAGQPVSFHQDGLTLVLPLSSPLPSAKPSFVTVEYSGTLGTADGSPVEGLRLAYVGPEGSYLLYPADWFPVNGDGLNRFSAAIAVTVPSDETVIASGKASAPVPEAGGLTTTYEYDHASFPGTVIAGKYAAQHGPGDITLYLKPAHEKLAAAYGESAGKIMAFYSDKFGPLANGRLAIAEIDDDTVGGYSAPGVVALASRGFSTPVNYKLLAHEISHQWWRCLVSPATPDDAFLDEGLATYSAAMYVQQEAGESAFEDTMHEVEINSLTHEEVAPIAQAGRLHEYTPEYQSIVFQKGAMVFHMLRWVIGDDAFVKTLRAVTQQYAGKSISTADFEKLAEKSSGQELRYFFAQWVDSTGVPQFKRTWAVYRTQKGYQVIGKITQDLDIFRMPVEVRVYSEGRKPANERVDMVGTTADFTINTVTRPTRVAVDPASRILKYDDRIKVDVEMAKGDQLVQQQAYLEAVDQYRKVLEINKNSSLAHYRIGETLFKLHNYNAAAEELRATLAGDLQPKWVEVWSHLLLGKIFDSTGQRDRALNEYQRALQTSDNTQGALDQANKYIQKPYSEDTSHQVGS